MQMEVRGVEVVSGLRRKHFDGMEGRWKESVSVSSVHQRRIEWCLLDRENCDDGAMAKRAVLCALKRRERRSVLERGDWSMGRLILTVDSVCQRQLRKGEAKALLRRDTEGGRY